MNPHPFSRSADFSSFFLELESIYATAPIGLCVLDIQGRFVRINNVLADINGLPVEQHLGRTVREVLPNLAYFVEALFDEVVETGEPRLNVEVRGETPAQPGVIRTWNEHWLPIKNEAGEVVAINIVAEETTGHKQLIEALRQSEEQFRVAFETANDAMALSDAAGLVIAANEAYCELYGYSCDEVVGQDFAVIFPEEFREQARAQYRQVFRGEMNLPTYEATIRRNDGTQRVVEARTGFVTQRSGRIAMLSVIRDLTTRKKLEDTIRTKYGLTTALARSVSVADVARITVEHLTGILNARAGHLFLIDATTKTVELIFTNSRSSSEQLAPWQRFAVTDELPIADVIKSKQPLWFASAQERELAYPTMAVFSQSNPGASVLLPLIVQGEVSGAISFDFAETRILDHEERDLIASLAQQCAQALERARLYESEQQARREAEQANETKMRFLGVISHELRTPLTTIKGFSHTLLANDVVWDAASQREFVGMISEEADKMQALIENLLDLTRLQSGTFRVNLKPYHAEEIVAATMPRLQALTPEHALSVQISPHLPLICADKTYLGQVLSNLVHNAAKYSPRHSTITVTAEQNGDRVEFHVADEGSGIPEEQWTEVFEEFRQLSNGQKGVGLGLAICKAIIGAHKGRIWVGEKPSPGTLMAFTIPLCDV